MKRLTVAVIILVSVMGMTSGVVSALPIDVPSADTYIEKSTSGIAHGGDGFLSAGTDGLCALGAGANETAYLRWDVGGASGNVKSARMTLDLWYNGATNSSSVVQLTLFRVADDTWDQATLTYNTPLIGGPTLGAVIQTIDVPFGYTGQIGFGAPFDAVSALSTYIAEEAGGDGKASFAIQATGCPLENQGVTMLFTDSENGTLGTPSNPGTAPHLTVWNPTAVALTTLEVQQPAPSWPLYIGLGVLALVMVGLLVYRRQAVAR